MKVTQKNWEKSLGEFESKNESYKDKTLREMNEAIGRKDKKKAKEDIVFGPSDEENRKCLQETFRLDKNNGVHQMARYFLHVGEIITLGNKRPETFVYQDGIFVEGSKILKKEIEGILNNLATTHHKKEILNKISDMTYVEKDAVKTPNKFICLLNGVLDIETGELDQHSPEYYFFKKIPIEYDPSANCPKIDAFIEHLVGEDQAKLVYQMFGFFLYREYFIKKAFILLGETDSGKTTLLNLIKKAMGSGNISSISLHKIASDRFSASSLQDMSINIYDDLDSDDIKATGAFKIVVGQGMVSAEKKFGDTFHFENYAKQVFACNKIPYVKDVDDAAYFNRWILLNFNNQIEKKDPHILEKVADEEELSGLLNRAVEELKSLLKVGLFAYDKSDKAIREEMMRSASIVATFAYDCLEEASGNFISKEDMYSKFCEYAHKFGKSETKERFGRHIKKHATYLNDGRKGNDKSRTTGWWNVRILAKEDELDSSTASNGVEAVTNKSDADNGVEALPGEILAEIDELNRKKPELPF